MTKEAKELRIKQFKEIFWPQTLEHAREALPDLEEYFL
jgi:hypothetical protein